MDNHYPSPASSISPPDIPQTPIHGSPLPLTRGRYPYRILGRKLVTLGRSEAHSFVIVWTPPPPPAPASPWSPKVLCRCCVTPRTESGEPESPAPTPSPSWVSKQGTSFFHTFCGVFCSRCSGYYLSFFVTPRPVLVFLCINCCDVESYPPSLPSSLPPSFPLLFSSLELLIFVT